MGLYFESLRLTEAEIPEGVVYRSVYQQGAHAQLAKGLVGFRAWLPEWLKEGHPEAECDGECVTTRRAFVDALLLQLDVALEQANIERPTRTA